MCRKAFKCLATADDIKTIAEYVQEQIRLIDPGDDDDVVFHNLDELEVLHTGDWLSGVEKYTAMTSEALVKGLGTTDFDTQLPSFNSQVDTSQSPITPWDKQNWGVLKITDKAALVVRWHQLVGVYKLMKTWFPKRRPSPRGDNGVLLMDEVGLGKTIQATGAITQLSYMRMAFSIKGKYPGGFSKSLYILRSDIT